ncbi:MAG: hypothetical protein K2I31_01530 [Duncaniella sp.]|nr:hypothetical protein [Duncaniella sp.]MDE5673435.1 hypothetical protein [Duncaniella sp.]
MKQHDITLPELLELIERFYDCSLSDEEERQLRVAISSTSFSHPSIDEAKALMGFRRPDAATRKNATPVRQSYTPRRRSNIRMTLSIAAALAILLTLGINLTDSRTQGNGSDGKCIAYANGKCITDENDIIRLLTDDLREFDDAVNDSDQSFADELGDIAPIIETYESPIDFSDI